MSAFKEIGKTYNRLMKINVLPLKGKRPMIEWERWQSELQTADDIDKMEWKNATGLGGIQGISDWRCLDLDGVENYEILDLLLTELGLPERYEWVVQSGSGAGFHIYIRVEQANDAEVFDRIGGVKGVYKFKMKQKVDEEGNREIFCKHIELRWKDCQTALPQSFHESGGIYNFYYNEPNDPPTNIELEKVIESLERFCSIDLRPLNNEQQKCNSREQQRENNGKVVYDKDKLESALEYLSQNLPTGSYDEWYKIGFALVPLEKEGEEYFVKMSISNPNYKENDLVIRKKFRSLAEDYDGRVSIGTIFHIAELYGWKKPMIKFWYRENQKLKISRIRFKKFLESEGFCKYRIDSSGDNSNNLFIRIENNVVNEVDSIEVKEFVMTHLEGKGIEEFEGTNRNEIIDTLIKSANQLFTQQFLEFLITRSIEFNKETADKGYFYFKNGYVEVSPNPKGEGTGNTGVTFYNYKKLNKVIWRKQIINRDFVQRRTAESRSVFEDFIFNVCRNDIKRFNALKSGIGYLLHTYKDPSIAKAVVFIDEKLSEGAYGRSGKGLVIKSISQVRNVVIEDGRNFNPAKNFAFQRVKADTNVIGFEDIRDKFPFERLFSIITDGITIERKNKDEIHIGYEESPKVVISTNFSISGIDDSTLDRQFIIEFSDFYNKYHRPVDDFGKPFFSGWNEYEWHSFYSFMIQCLQYYLSNGLVEYVYVNLEKKKMIDETCPEFVEFVESTESGIVPGKEYEKKELFDSFKQEYEDFDPMGGGRLTQSKFTRWLKVWGKVKGVEVKEGKSGAKRWIRFGGGS